MDSYDYSNAQEWIDYHWNRVEKESHMRTWEWAVYRKAVLAIKSVLKNYYNSKQSQEHSNHVSGLEYNVLELRAELRKQKRQEAELKERAEKAEKERDELRVRIDKAVKLIESNITPAHAINWQLIHEFINKNTKGE